MKKVVDFLASLRLAIFLFLALAVTSIVGTILPQGRDPSFYLMKYGNFWGKVINALELSDAYHSWWYVTLLSIFLVNLTVCSLKRFPISLKLYKRNPWEVDLKKLPFRRELKVSSSPQKVEEFLKKLGFRFREFSGGRLGVRDRFRWSYFSVYFVHGSILVIVVGALIGAVYGYRGSMNILEGERSNKVLPFGKRAVITLPFYIHLNKFEIEYYPNGMPKDYRSHVTVIDGNKTLNATIRVNHPLEYREIRFYQASYQEYASVRVKAKVGSKEKEIEVRPFSDGSWDEEELTLGLIQYGEAHGFKMAKVWVTKSGSEPVVLWLIEGHKREVNFSPTKVELTLLEAKPLFMTGLQVRKDPGVGLVWLGFILMILGVFAAFFFTHKRIWVFLKEDEKGTYFLVGGFSKRYREDLKRELEALCNSIKGL